MSTYEDASLIMPQGFGVKAGTLYNLKPVDGLGDFTVVRNSIATYLDKDGTRKTAAIDVPRRDYTDEACGVLLTEPQSTNIYLNSDVLVTQGVTTTADEWTVSFKGTGTITFTGTFIGSLVGTGSLDSDVVSLTFTATAGTLTSTVTGTVENAQCENLGYNTSWILTAGSTVTRLKDEIGEGGTVNDFNSEEGVLYCEIEPIQTGTKIALYDSATNFDNRVTIEIQTNTAYRFIYESDDLNKILTVNVSDTLLPANIAFCWGGTDIKIYIDGVEVASNGNANPFTPDILNTLSFTNAFGNGDFFYGKTKQIKVYKSIADAQKDLPYITN